MCEEGRFMSCLHLMQLQVFLPRSDVQMKRKDSAGIDQPHINSILSTPFFIFIFFVTVMETDVSGAALG